MGLMVSVSGGGKFLQAVISRHYRSVVCSNKVYVEGHLLRLMVGFCGILFKQ